MKSIRHSVFRQDSFGGRGVSAPAVFLTGRRNAPRAACSGIILSSLINAPFGSENYQPEISVFKREAKISGSRQTRTSRKCQCPILIIQTKSN
jgi:hypothetical protein